MIYLLAAVFTAGTVFIAYGLFSLRKHFSVLPPGPPDHFLLGNVKYMAPVDPADVLMKACWEHGKKGMLRFRYPFQAPLVLLYKPDIVAEMFEKHSDKMNNRDMLSETLNEFSGEGKDIFVSNGEYWKAARKVFVQGVMTSVNRSIPIIEKHLRSAIDALKSKELAVQNVRDVLTVQTFNVIADMSVGRIPMSEELVKEYIALTDRINVYLDPVNPRNLIPGLKYIPYQDECRRAIALRDQILQQVIDQHRKTLDIDNPQDFLDSVLADAERDKEFPLSLVHVLLDTFVGGTDTSSSTIELLIGYLANHPEIQKKVHEELDAVVKNRYPTLDDEKNLPYLNAVLKEVLRIKSVAAILMRHATEDIPIDGYTIPKGTRILVLTHALFNDPELWVNPQEFRPERFLEEEKEITIRGGEMPKVKDHLKYTVFGIGKRGCAGFQLARKELFLQAAYYLWAFEFSTPEHSKKIDLSMVMGLVSKPKDAVQVRAKYRH
jgi:cytochrome P450